MPASADSMKSVLRTRLMEFSKTHTNGSLTVDAFEASLQDALSSIDILERQLDKVISSSFDSYTADEQRKILVIKASVRFSAHDHMKAVKLLRAAKGIPLDGDYGRHLEKGIDDDHIDALINAWSR